MRLFTVMASLIALAAPAFAQSNNITVNCFFRGSGQKGSAALRCHAVANLHFIGQADDHLLVNCPGLGQNTVVYNDDAEFTTNSTIVINPAGSETRPSVTLPGDAFDCSQTPQDFDAALRLPERAPYGGAMLIGSCMVVTAGCD